MTFSIVLFDPVPQRTQLLPLTATRPIANLRVGVMTLDQKWGRLFGAPVHYATVEYLQGKFPFHPDNKAKFYINAAILPNPGLFQALLQLRLGDCLLTIDGEILAFSLSENVSYTDIPKVVAGLNPIVFREYVEMLQHPEDIFRYNASQINFDLQHILSLEELEKASFETFNTMHGEAIYIAKSAKVQQVYLDASQGPIYIADNAVVEPGTCIYGPVVIGESTRVKANTLIYPNVTIGPRCTVAGELNNTVVWGNSAKGHEGYLGCAVLGEGCNLGAGTTNSNLKNDWSTVKLYDYSVQGYRDTGLSKCGVIIGDQAMLAIQSKINTGTVIGVGSQVAMSNIIPKFVPDYSWYTDSVKESYIYERFVHMMQRKASLKREEFTNRDEAILQEVYVQTLHLRNY